MQSVTLFYHYGPVPDHEEEVSLHKSFLTEKDLLGRVRIAPEGINATVGGDESAVDAYEAFVKERARGWRRAQLEKSGGVISDSDVGVSIDFKRRPVQVREGEKVFDSDLLVRPCKEIVTLGVRSLSAQAASGHLAPQEFHNVLADALASESKADTDDGNDASSIYAPLRLVGGERKIAVIDARNRYESRIGHFVGHSAPNTRQFSELPAYLDKYSSKLESAEAVLMYCTGGIRCEKTSAYVVDRLGIPREKVFQLEGGVARYLEWAASQDDQESLFKGKLLMFDGGGDVNSGSGTVGACHRCGAPWDEYLWCPERQRTTGEKKTRCGRCRALVLICNTCRPEVSEENPLRCVVCAPPPDHTPS